ncbi:hypothetical protein MMC30_008100 [Trapelia coarctata]|nr:hypothetical protein [Trapelia coarctata]
MPINWAYKCRVVGRLLHQCKKHMKILQILQQSFPGFTPTLKQLKAQLKTWGFTSTPRIGALDHTNGRIKPASEIPRAETRRRLGLSDQDCNVVRVEFRIICDNKGIRSKSTTDKLEWNDAMWELMSKNRTLFDVIGSVADEAARNERCAALELLCRLKALQNSG